LNARHMLWGDSFGTGANPEGKPVKIRKQKITSGLQKMASWGRISNSKKTSQTSKPKRIQCKNEPGKTKRLGEDKAFPALEIGGTATQKSRKRVGGRTKRDPGQKKTKLRSWGEIHAGGKRKKRPVSKREKKKVQVKGGNRSETGSQKRGYR